jgi:hypothetical protein
MLLLVVLGVNHWGLIVQYPEVGYFNEYLRLVRKRYSLGSGIGLW